jgi:ribosome recycling factor
MIDTNSNINEAKKRMENAIKFLDDTLSHIRAGKADIRILDGIKVEAYGQPAPINTVASVSTPDPRSIVIKPWDKTMLHVIEKAIIDSEVGIMPENNGEIIRIGIPPLTEERRKILTKQCNKEAEAAKITIRNARHEILEKLKKGIKEGLSEDSEKDAEDNLQKVHDTYIKEVDKILAAKNKEIMTV